MSSFLLLCAVAPVAAILLAPRRLINVHCPSADVVVLTIAPLVVWAAASLRMGMRERRRGLLTVVLIGGGLLITPMSSRIEAGFDSPVGPRWSDYWTIVVGARVKEEGGGHGREVYVREIWRARCTKQEYVDALKAMNERYRPRQVLVESVAAQEYLAQDAEKHMPVRRLERTKDKVSRAYWLQAFFENGQILFPATHLQRNRDVWQALTDELILFPNADHDDLFDGLQTAMEGAIIREPEPRIRWL